MSNYVAQVVNFHTRILDCDSHSPVLLDLFISFHPSIYFTVAFSPLGNSGHVIISVFILLSFKFNGEAPLHCTAYGYPREDWDCQFL